VRWGICYLVIILKCTYIKQHIYTLNACIILLVNYISIKLEVTLLDILYSALQFTVYLHGITFDIYSIFGVSVDYNISILLYMQSNTCDYKIFPYILFHRGRFPICLLAMLQYTYTLCRNIYRICSRSLQICPLNFRIMQFMFSKMNTDFEDNILISKLLY
jgi:hypothetical protein